MCRKKMRFVLAVAVVVVLVACASGPHRSVLRIQPDPGKMSITREDAAMAYDKAVDTGTDMGFKVIAASRAQGTVELYRTRSTDMVPETITVDIVNKGPVADVNIAYESPRPIPDLTLKEFTDKLSERLRYGPARARTPASNPGQLGMDNSGTGFVLLLKNSNVRTEASARSDIIVTLRKGERLVKIGDTGTWVNVRLSSGETGWILKSLVKDAD
jgi:hypothetical protein